ncbi:MAG: hypothetical protein CMK59_13885 [Proteobacteria bacterium]|nr:hypothetical protein [Pseudomonadota bacterium]
MLTLIISGAAHSFCGTYVGSADSNLLSHTSQVAMVRQANQTTLTLANDYEGALSEFALVIPVPSVLNEEDVSILDPSVLQRAEIYSGPRLVEYSCEDFYSGWSPWSPSLGCQSEMMYESIASEDSYGESSKESVQIESSFAVGEYELAVVSATNGEGLNTWLEINGFALGANASDILQEYIEGESYFLVAKVTLDGLPEGQSWLSPLQLSYESPVFSLPIRLGTVNSPGEQDLLIYTLTDYEEGQIGIQNYEELTMETDCMLNSQDFGADYGARLGSKMNEAGGAWIREYSWAPYHCDPCAEGDALSDEDVQALGYDGSAFDAYFNRIRMRYTPEEAVEDLVLYPSGIIENSQMRYIQYSSELESRFPTCGIEWNADQDDSCQDLFDEWDKEAKREERGCFSSRPDGRAGTGALALVLTGLMLVRRRIT